MRNSSIENHFCSWDKDRRFLPCCELDATFIYLHAIDRADMNYIMKANSIVKRRINVNWSNYRNKIQTIDIYDYQQNSIDTGNPYDNLLVQPVADPRVAHSVDNQPSWAMAGHNG